MKNFLITGRALLKNKVTSGIAIIGFSVSLSVALIIIAYILGEYRMDKCYTHLHNIYRVIANENKTSVREDFREYLINTYPEIKDAARYNYYESNLTCENHPYTGGMIVTDTSFFNLFSIDFVAGDPSCLSDPDAIVLTESFAKKIFGDDDPLDKTLVIEYDSPLVIKGIVKDFPENSSVSGDFIINSVKKIKYEGWSDGMGTEVNYFRLFVLTGDNISMDDFSAKVNEDVSRINFYGGYKIDKIGFLPLKDSYFSSGLERSQTSHANLRLIRLLITVTVIIILLAIFNYTNLATAGHTYRYKEIAIKKTTGAGRLQIFKHFMLESFILCFLSLIIAMYLATFLKPFIESFLGSKVDMSLLYSPAILIWILSGVLILTFLTGFYPAYAISGLKPAFILSKRDALKNNSLGLRAVLNILQNAVSVALVIALIILSKQIGFVRTKDFGFETEKLLRVDLHWRMTDKTGQIRDRLLSYPSIKDVCFSHGSPGSIYLTSSWDVNGYSGEMKVLSTDSSFFNVFQIPVIMGRKPLPSDFNNVCFINETAFKTAGWQSITGERFQGKEIIGVVKDFNFENLYNPITPLAIQLTSEMGISHMSLRIGSNDLPGTIEILKKTWNDLCPGHELTYQFYDEWLDSMYKSEEKLSSAISFFAILAIIISCLGIIGMAEFTIRRRVKEIGIRKVNGARISEIMLLLNRDIVKWSLIGFILAVAPVWFIMNSWLQTFAYRTKTEWWIFVFAGLLSMIIGLLTVSWQSMKAATRNPVESLRYE